MKITFSNEQQQRFTVLRIPQTHSIMTPRAALAPLVLCWFHISGRVLRANVHLSSPACFSLADKHAYGHWLVPCDVRPASGIGHCVPQRAVPLLYWRGVRGFVYTVRVWRGSLCSCRGGCRYVTEPEVHSRFQHIYRYEPCPTPAPPEAPACCTVRAVP